MKRITAIVALVLVGCPEPSKQGQYDQIATSIKFLHTWDVSREAEGQFAYDAIMGSDDHILYSLVGRLTDETPTAIHDRPSGRTVVVGDIAFVMLLKRMGKTWQEFSDEGVFMSKLHPNPIFGIKWDPGARARVKARFIPLLPTIEEIENPK